MARGLADTARLHQEPHEVERFEQIADESEQRACHLDDITRARSAPGGPIELALIDEHEAAIRASDGPPSRRSDTLARGGQGGLGGTRSYILVVDDDEGIREVIETILADEGYDVICVRNRGLALRVLQERVPALVLFDLVMPDLNGEDFITAFRQGPNGTPPLVLVSGAADLDQVAAQIGADAFLTKPFELTELLDTVQTALTSRAGARASEPRATDTGGGAASPAAAVGDIGALDPAALEARYT